MWTNISFKLFDLVDILNGNENRNIIENLPPIGVFSKPRQFNILIYLLVLEFYEISKGSMQVLIVCTRMNFCREVLITL